MEGTEATQPDESQRLRSCRRKLDELRERESQRRAELELLKEAYRQLLEERVTAASKEKRREPVLPPTLVGDEELRHWFYRLSAAFTPMVAVESGDSRFLVPTRDMGSIGRRLFARGGYAGDTLPRMLQAVEEAGANVVRGGAIFDIGANIGSVVIPAVSQHGYDRGVAFEAHPTTAHVLRLNVLQSRLVDRVQVVEVALGANDGVAAMRAHGTSGGQRVLKGKGDRASAPIDAADPGLVEVPVARLDTLVERGTIDVDSVSLLWMDVQGYESAVLQGASSLLAAPPLVVTEFCPRRLNAYGELASMLDLIQAHFTHVIDLKVTLKTQKLSIVPVERLPELVERIGDRFTDLALVRVPRS